MMMTSSSPNTESETATTEGATAPEVTLEIPNLTPVEANDASGENTEAPTYQELQAMCDELHQQHLRLAADFDNFRKRRLMEMEQQRKYGAEHFLKNFLPVLDNFERAQGSVTPESDPATLYKTLDLMQQQLRNALEETGLKRCNVLDEPFDPALHEAVSQLTMPGKAPGTIIAEQQAGYMLHDKLIRHAQVIVSTTPEETA
jgi:molecular chaperone GrpE